MRTTFRPCKRQRVGGAFTLVELLVVISIIAILMAILMPALSRAREQGKRAVCLNHIRQLQIAWGLYNDDNNDKIPCGDVWFSWGFPGPANNQPIPQLAWHEWPHPFPHALPPSATTNKMPRDPPAPYCYDCVAQGTCKKPEWIHAIEEGTMFKYVKDYTIYQCPVGRKGEYVTYAMSHAMNTYPNSGGTNAQPAPTILLASQMKKTSERFVFLDAGQAKQGAFFAPYSSSGCLRWGDTPPMRHGQGTTFSFADGHCSYRKWTDPHAIDIGLHGPWGDTDCHNCDCDLRWFSKSTWGKLLYTCDDPSKKCDE